MSKYKLYIVGEFDPEPTKWRLDSCLVLAENEIQAKELCRDFSKTNVNVFEVETKGPVMVHHFWRSY